MYNHDIKVAFIRSYTESVQTAKTLERIFSFTEPFEISLGKDLCEMTREEVVQALSKRSVSTYGTSNTTISYLRTYGRWCIANHIPGAREDIMYLTSSSISDAAAKMVAGPYDLQRILDYTLQKEDELTTDNAIRAYYWMVFAGMERNDTVHVKRENVNFQRMCIVFDGREYPIYPQALPSIRNCVELTTFRYIHPKYEPVLKNRYHSDYILRLIKGDADAEEFEKQYARKRTLAKTPEGRKFSYSTLRKSGFFYRYYLLAREHAAAPFEEVAPMFVDPKGCKDEAEMYRAVYLLKKDYEIWKNTFNN